MTDANEPTFEEWFGGLEGYHVRSERFYDDLEAGDRYTLKLWLEEAWMQGAKSRPRCPLEKRVEDLEEALSYLNRLIDSRLP